MARVFIHRELVGRIASHGLTKELRAFVIACQDNEHPPRVYKPSGVAPVYLPYKMLNLYHHHLHRDGDPLLVTQNIEDEIYGIALATHQTYFQGDKMRWLQQHAEAIDWSDCAKLRKEVQEYESYEFDDGED